MATPCRVVVCGLSHRWQFFVFPPTPKFATHARIHADGSLHLEVGHGHPPRSACGHDWLSGACTVVQQPWDCLLSTNFVSHSTQIHAREFPKVCRVECPLCLSSITAKIEPHAHHLYGFAIVRIHSALMLHPCDLFAVYNVSICLHLCRSPTPQQTSAGP